MCALTQCVMKAAVQGVDPAPCLENRGKHSVCTRTREPASVRALSRQIPTTFTPPMSRYRSLVT